MQKPVYYIKVDEGNGLVIVHYVDYEDRMKNKHENGSYNRLKDRSYTTICKEGKQSH